jgi:murein DD-endopeptidase MepM/ murein hydrolase activator NlpD
MAEPWAEDLLAAVGPYRGPSAPAPAGGSDTWSLAQRAAQRHGLDPSLLAGVWDFESGNNPGAVNKSSRATGLGQVMPREAGFPDRPTQQELLDPETNAEWSARILKSGLSRYGSEDKALAAYLGAIDARGNITGAVDANGTGGNQYIRTVRERQKKYGAATTTAAPLTDRSGGAEPWAQDLLAAVGSTQPSTPLPSRGAVRAGSAEPWAEDLLRVAGPDATGSAPSASRGEGSYAGPAQTDEVWPVVGQKWGQVNNPFGGNQARSAGATVALPSRNVGADLTARYGAEVIAPVSGTVVEVFDAPDERDRNANHGWGGMTLLKGDNGYYYRMSHAQPGSIATRPGMRVAQGQPLQRVGVSGNTTGAHLDYEKFDQPGHFVDPVATAGRAVAGVGSAVSGAAQTAGAWVDDLLRSAGAR